MTDQEFKQWIREKIDFSKGLLIEVFNEQVSEDPAMIPAKLWRDIHTSALVEALILINSPTGLETKQDLVNHLENVMNHLSTVSEIVDSLRGSQPEQSTQRATANLN